MGEELCDDSRYKNRPLTLFLSACSHSRSLSLTQNAALMYAFGLLKWGSRGFRLTCGCGHQDQRQHCQPLSGWMGSRAHHGTLCVAGAGGVPRPPRLRPVLLGSVLDILGHSPSVLTPCSRLRAEWGRSKTETTGPKRKGLNYLLLVPRGFMRRPPGGAQPVS